MKLRHHRFVFYFSWFCLAFIQSSLTELQDDEAYYWVFSKFPAWGYFDHPPMTAMLIRAGYLVFHNELGVRLLFLFINLFSLLLIEKLTERKNPVLFYAIALSISVLQLGGFMAVPDTPLVFFSALFFLALRKYFTRNTWRNVAFLGITIALLFYTKYHAVLVVALALISYPKFFRDIRLYVAGAIALLLFLPHLAWEYQHHWVSFRYHLFESNVDPYRINYTTDYVAGQIVLAGPVAAFVLLPAALLYRTKTPLEKALKWVLCGTYIFFFLSSFRGKVEPNWTMPVIAPLIVLSHQYLLEKPLWLRWLWRTLPVSLILILMARIIMIADIIPLRQVKDRFHAWKSWPEEMKRRTQGLPVVFSNSYQRASKYWFYTGQVTFSQNHVRDHRNNYDLWPIEDSLLGKAVYFLDTYGTNRFKSTIKTPIGVIGYRFDSTFLSFTKIQFIPVRYNYTLEQKDTLRLKVKVKMPAKYYDYLRFNPEPSTTVKFFVMRHRDILLELTVPRRLDTTLLAPFEVSFPIDLRPGKYRALFSIESAGYNPTHNSDPIAIKISE